MHLSLDTTVMIPIYEPYLVLSDFIPLRNMRTFVRMLGTPVCATPWCDQRPWYDQGVDSYYGATMKTWEPTSRALLNPAPRTDSANWWLCYGRVFKRPHYLFPYQCTDTLKRMDEGIREVYITRL